MSKIPVLPPATAQQMLENIFRACNRPSNTVPLKTLAAYSNYRKERFAMQRTAIVVMLVLFMLLPFLFITAEMDVTKAARSPGENPVYHIRFTSAVPVRHVTARMGGITQPIYEDENGVYTLQPAGNGEMVVEATFFNLQKTTASLPVTDADWEMPALLDTRRSGDNVLMYFSDNLSGIRADAISVTNAAGQELPFSYDTASQCLTLARPETTCYLSVPDERGNVLQLVLSP
ncbi:MAG: hypothetical protein IJB69_06025 [Clostridia bacterium]|nr:hypothetical protein [Clostridia bacterium]